MDAGQSRPEQPHLGQPRHEVRGERALLPPPAYVRERLGVEESPDRRPYLAFLGRQQVAYGVEVQHHGRLV